MAREAGEENFFLFGLTAEQVTASASWYSPKWHYEHESETRRALDLIFANHFNRSEPGIFAPLRDMLLTRGDHFMHLADLTSYTKAHEKLGATYTDAETWTKMAIRNVACSGAFSSDRTIGQYAAEIWKAEACPVE
jgi:starch phosphorylase